MTWQASGASGVGPGTARVRRRALVVRLCSVPVLLAGGLAAPAVAAPAAGAAAAAALVPAASAPAAIRPLGLGGDPGPPIVSEVASGAFRRFGEPAAAATQAGQVVAASSFVSGAEVMLWSRPGASGSWSAGSALLPAGFVASYDPAASPGPGGTVLVAVGASVAGPAGCLNGGSVFLDGVDPATGGRAAPVLVDDERAGSGFDDRPAVATGPAGRVWVAWSHGPAADRCQVVGHDDAIQFASSTDGGRSFTAPVTLARPAGGAAFGVSIVPMGGGKAALAWAETTPAGALCVVVARVGGSGVTGAPQVVATSVALPRILPGASFYAFSVARAALVGDGRLALVWPAWQAGRGEVMVALGTPGAQGWSSAAVAPAPGQDLLLPAVAAAGPGRALVVYADHTRIGDALGYDSVALDVSGAPAAGPAESVIPAVGGPGFFELGETLSLGTFGSSDVATVVSGSPTASRVLVASWSLPTALVSPSPSPAAPPSASAPASRLATGTSSPGSRSEHSGRSGSGSHADLILGALVAAVLVGSVIVLRARALRRMRRRR